MQLLKILYCSLAVFFCFNSSRWIFPFLNTEVYSPTACVYHGLTFVFGIQLFLFVSYLFYFWFVMMMCGQSWYSCWVSSVFGLVSIWGITFLLYSQADNKNPLDMVALEEASSNPTSPNQYINADLETPSKTNNPNGFHYNSISMEELKSVDGVMRTTTALVGLAANDPLNHQILNATLIECQDKGAFFYPLMLLHAADAYELSVGIFFGSGLLLLTHIYQSHLAHIVELAQRLPLYAYLGAISVWATIAFFFQ